MTRHSRRLTVALCAALGLMGAATAAADASPRVRAVYRAVEGGNDVILNLWNFSPGPIEVADSRAAITLDAPVVIAEDGTGHARLHVPAGAYPGDVAVRAQNAGGQVAGTHFEVVRPQLDHAPLNAVAGAPFAVTGSGWPAGAALQARLDGMVCNIEFITNDDGTVDGTCTPHGILPGPHELTVSVTDSCCIADASAGNVTVQAGHDDAPTLVSVGRSFRFQGEAFAPLAPIRATLSGTPLTVHPHLSTDPLQSNAFGSFDAVATMPDFYGTGPHTIRFYDDAYHVASVVVRVFRPRLTVSYVAGSDPRRLRVRGDGWPENLSVSLRIGDPRVYVCTFTTSATGDVANPEGTCRVPDGVGGGVQRVELEASWGLPGAVTHTPVGVVSDVALP